MKWIDSHIEIDAPKRPKKITGTRFATILGLNPWSTAFEMWCEITKTYQTPFEDTIYTIAGKAIEPTQIEYMRKAYAMDNLKTPTDIYGADYFKKTWGDFFGQIPIFGGMWDARLDGDGGMAETVIEFKTTKRAEDWGTDVPEYYALQAALYAYLLGVDDVIMIASFLEPSDYDAPESFEPSSENTITIEFKVSERYPDFSAKIAQATAWWNAHVVTGISPDYDEKKDAEILKALRTNNLTPDTDIDALVKEAEKLKTQIAMVTMSVADKEKRLKELFDIIKEHSIGQFRDGDKKVEIKGNAYTWAVARSERVTIDKDSLTADGLLDKYGMKATTYTLTVK